LHTIIGLQTEQRVLSSIADSSISLPLSTANASPWMIRSTNNSKLQYDFLIRMIGTGIIMYHSLNYSSVQRNIPKRRLDMVGLMGFILVAAFVFVQHVPQVSAIYEWMRVLYIVILVSPVINDVSMHDAARIQFMMSGQIVNFVTTLMVRFVYESVYASEFGQSWSIRGAVLLFWVVLSCVLFVMAQNMITDSKTMFSIRHIFAVLQRGKVHTEVDSVQQHHHHQYHQRPMEWRRIIRDICHSHNVQMWIGMQVFMEIQMSALYLVFLHTILYPMDDVGHTRVIWTLFRLRKVDTIVIHIPMYTFGYAGVYYTLFCTITGLSLFVLVTTSSESIGTVYILTMVFYLSTMAVHAAGFNLAMADITMSLRHSLLDRRLEEPNIAGILIALSSFICKPITYFVSGILANLLHHSRSIESASRTAFYCVVIVPLVCSVLQLLFWRRYDLLPHRTALMRDEIDQSMPK
jgi:hypothetical protein